MKKIGSFRLFMAQKHNGIQFVDKNPEGAAAHYPLFEDESQLEHHLM